MTNPIDRPLSGIRVVDLAEGPFASIARYLAELGATVDRVVRDVPADPIAAVAANIGKVNHLRPTDQEVVRLIADAHVVVESGRLDPALVPQRRPGCVWMTVTPFGTGNRYSGWQATDPVFHALSGQLARSGIRGRPPLLPPLELGFQCAATQGAYLLLTALYRALRTGKGEHLDYSGLDGAVQALDPGFGVGGSATMGKPARDLHRGRPAVGIQYPILPCADGQVRICLLSPRQWDGMFRWLGEPAQFAGPEFRQMVTRYKSPDQLPAIGAMFAAKTRAQLEREGQAHGVPIAALLSLGEFIKADHPKARGALAQVETPRLGPVEVPNGMLTVDGVRMGVAATAANGTVYPELPPQTTAIAPYAGLRVLDMGVIVVGAEAGRLFADGGADVVKVESHAFPDGNRQSYLPYGLSVSFAAGHRNKRSLGIDLRSTEGRELFLRLAGTADIILSNFKPGTLENLGLCYEEVAKINPGIVMVDSSAFGPDGPWSARMGYGPLVRASTGLTELWRYPDDPEGFSDSVTVYPDHAAGRVSALAAVALLIRRLRSGRGGRASVSQAEVMLGQAAENVARLSRGMPVEPERDAPWGVFAARGDDAFAVVTVRDDDDWQKLCRAIGRTDLADDPALADANGRRNARARIDAAVAEWCAAREPVEIGELLQTAGVPAAPMLRVGDQLEFPYFVERSLFRVERHPHLKEAVISEDRQYRSSTVWEVPRGPAPLPGEQSEAVVGAWLGLPEEQLAQLLAANVLQATPAETFELIQRTLAA